MTTNKTFLTKAETICKELGMFYVEDFKFAWIEKYGTYSLLPTNSIMMRLRHLENITTIIDNEMNSRFKLRSDTRLYLWVD